MTTTQIITAFNEIQAELPALRARKLAAIKANDPAERIAAEAQLADAKKRQEALFTE
jgi:hypothetical protein